MAYSPGDLRREVHALIAAQLELGHTVIRGWVEHDVLTKHPLPLIPDQDFNVMCRKEQVSRAVRDVLRDLKLAAEDPESVSGSGTMTFPGFKHLQLGYPFKSDDGELIIKPIARMTSPEHFERADSYDRMAVGCREHADELRRHARMIA